MNVIAILVRNDTVENRAVFPVDEVPNDWTINDTAQIGWPVKNGVPTEPVRVISENEILNTERGWVSTEIPKVQIQLDYITDGDYAERTNFWGADEVALRAYRVALKNYISADGTINGDRPARP